MLYQNLLKVYPQLEGSKYPPAEPGVTYLNPEIGACQIGCQLLQLGMMSQFINKPFNRFTFFPTAPAQVMRFN